MGAVQEVVVYSNTGDYNMKGHFASYDATQPHWNIFGWISNAIPCILRNQRIVAKILKT